MKKLLSIFSVFCFTLIAGVCLTACQGVTDQIISFKEYDKNVYEVTLLKDGETMTSDENGKFAVTTEDEITVKISAVKYGVDFSELVVKINNQSKSLNLNKNYSGVAGGDLYYGWFTIPMKQIKSDVEVDISGAKQMQSTFTFEATNLADDSVVEKLTGAKINLETIGGEYVNLYTYLTSEAEKTYTRTYDATEGNANTYRTFKLKFEYDQKEVVGIYDFSEQNLPFTIKTANGVERAIAGCTLVNDNYYLVDLGDIGEEKAYTIVVDFSLLKFKKFQISRPVSNSAYAVELGSSTIDYSQEGTVAVSKLLDDSIADYSNMKVKLNNLELEEVVVPEPVENVSVYKIPKHITPEIVGGTNVYTLKIEGIEYKVDFYSLYANSTDGGEENPLVIPEITGLDEEGNKISVGTVGSNGQHVVFDGQKVAVVWSYRQVGGNYRTVYDLYDYNIYGNGTKILNIKEQIGEATENVEKTVGVYTLKATYNATTQKFDSFSLEFVCSEDVIFTFRDFVKHQKSAKIGYSFDDSRVEGVSFAIIDNAEAAAQIAEWTSLTGKDDLRQMAVYAHQYVAFRLDLAQTSVGAFELVVADSTVSDASSSITYSDAENDYLVLIFRVSNAYFDGAKEFKLVKAGS
ncbi:MAG: hypothetical protein J6K39_03690 [Clostridia bacterium]|nr:hypothetical protein [Clostridia bacterium]